MTFTNTDSVREDIYWYFHGQACGQVNGQLNDQVWNQVDDQINWKVYGQINFIKTKIHQDINK